MSVKFMFNGREFIIQPAKYSNNNNLALLFRREEDDENDYYGLISVNTALTLPNNMAAIKDYSENEGIFEALKKQDIISDPVRYISSGYITIPVVKVVHKELLNEITKYYKEH